MAIDVSIMAGHNDGDQAGGSEHIRMLAIADLTCISTSLSMHLRKSGHDQVLKIRCLSFQLVLGITSWLSNTLILIGATRCTPTINDWPWAAPHSKQMAWIAISHSGNVHVGGVKFIHQ